MARWQRWRDFFARTVAAAALAGTSGCLCYLHTPPPPNHPCYAPCVGLPKCARDKVHIVFVHGADPFDCANLEGVREHLHHLGFLQVWSGSPLRKGYFARELRRAAQEVPDARFVLIGFGHGAATAGALAHELAPDGLVFDRLIAINGHGLDDYQADNVQKLVSIRRGAQTHNDAPGYREQCHIEQVSHFGTPTHPQTLEAIAEELQSVTMSVPVVLPAGPPPLTETAPTPRPLPPAKERDGGEWDFIRPTPQLEPLPPPRELPSSDPERRPGPYRR